MNFNTLKNQLFLIQKMIKNQSRAFTQILLELKKYLKFTYEID